MKVWVTRDEAEDGPFCAALRAAGLQPVLEPVLEQRVVEEAARAITDLGPDDWLVLTSPFAIKTVMQQAKAVEAARVPRVAVIGESSQRLAQQQGLRVELVSLDGNRDSLFEQLRTRVQQGTVCYPRSSLAPAPSAWPNVRLISPILYETLVRAFDRTVAQRVDVVAVTSPSAVSAIGPLDLPFASIGPSTSQALRQIGKKPWVEAPKRSLESLAGVIADQAQSSRQQRA